MAVTGIGQGNMVYQPYQQRRADKNGETPGFDEAYSYGSSAYVQEMTKEFRNPDIAPDSVDPRNASYEEIQALNDYLVGRGWLKEGDLDSFEHPTKDDAQKADYLSALRKWRDAQYQAGNMVGYKNAAKVCDAWTNVIAEKNGAVSEMNGVRFFQKEGSLHSGIIGFGTLEDGTTYSASYASDSTVGNPVIEIRMQRRNGKEELYMVSPREVDPKKASQLEMFALCAYADSQEILGSPTSGTYQKLLSYAQNSAMGDKRAKSADAFMSDEKDWSSYVTNSRIEKLNESGKVKEAWGKTIQNLFDKLEQQNGDKKRVEGRSESELIAMAFAEGMPEDNGVPYFYMAKDGIIDYNGVVFFCDEEHRAICLGDTSDKSKCLNIPLSGGGSLIVNRDNLSGLAKAIGMFSPEDVNLIMRAIAEDAKIQQMKQQIDDETSGLDLAEKTGGDGEDGEETVVETLVGEGISGEGVTKESVIEEKTAETSAAEKTAGMSAAEKAAKKKETVLQKNGTGETEDDRNRR